jgi:glycosyltransferase involved in cell wall biosynthesis
MHVLIVTQYFWPENFRINELAESLIARGVDIDVLTGKPNYPDGAIYQGYRATGVLREYWHGAKILRVPIIPRGIRSGVRLFANYLTFILSGTVLGAWCMRRVKPDVILVYAPSPLLQAIPALFIGWLKQIPVVVYVQDVWPESLSATGYVRNKQIIWLVKQIVKFIYHHTDLILVSSLPFKESINKYTPKASVIYYPNSVDPSFGDPDSGLKPKVPELEEGFCVVFAGNIGSGQGLSAIVQAASLLQQHTSAIRLVLIGSGSEIERIRQQSLALGNLFLVGRYPPQAMPNLLSRASALLATLADKEIFAATVPNKIQAYLAVGRPIIAAMNGEGARLVVEARAGLAVPAENAEALAAAILRMYEMSEAERLQMGANGKKYYQEYFHHDQLVSDLLEHLTNSVKEFQ